MHPGALVSLAIVSTLVSCNHRSGLRPEPPAPPAPASAAAPAHPRSVRKAFPGRFEVYRTLLANADLPLTKASHCDGVIGADAGPNPTLGDWIAYNLSVLENGTLSLPVACRAEGAGTRCRVEFGVENSADNVLWRWGVDFGLNADGTLDRASVSCTGAG